MALRVCTGAFKTSPIESIYVDSGFPPLAIRREEQGLRYVSRALTSQSNPNYKYIRNPADRAPTKPTLPKPLEVRLGNSAREVGLIPPPIMEITPSKFPPWCRPPIRKCKIRDNKRNSTSIQLKSNFLAHASEHSSSIAVFTDGSKTADGVGCSVVIGARVVEKSLDSKFSVFNAEIYAIYSCLKIIYTTGSAGDSFIIHCDSQSTLAALEKFISSNPLVQEVQDWLVLLHRKQIEIKFCWVPSHVGIRGNELADAAAKRAASSPGSCNLKVPSQDFKLFIKSFIKIKWQDQWSNLNSNFKLKSIRPSVQPWPHFGLERRSSIILTRLRIGHTFLTHRYLLTSGAERLVPQCSRCNVDITVKHIFIDCPRYFNSRRKFGLNNKPLSDILGVDAPIEEILKFLKDINLFYDI